MRGLGAKYSSSVSAARSDRAATHSLALSRNRVEPSSTGPCSLTNCSISSGVAVRTINPALSVDRQTKEVTRNSKSTCVACDWPRTLRNSSKPIETVYSQTLKSRSLSKLLMFIILT